MVIYLFVQGQDILLPDGRSSFTRLSRNVSEEQFRALQAQPPNTFTLSPAIGQHKSVIPEKLTYFLSLYYRKRNVYNSYFSKLEASGPTLNHVRKDRISAGCQDTFQWLYIY